MGVLTLITALFFLNFCNQTVNNENIGTNYSKLSSNVVEVSREVQIELDSIIVKYWKSSEANEYQYFYKKGKLNIRSEYFGFEKNIEDENIKNKFLTYVNDLYMNNVPIVLSKKNELSYVSSFSAITTIGYVDGSKIFDKKNTFYSNLEFNPKFLEFYNFLDSLVL